MTSRAKRIDRRLLEIEPSSAAEARLVAVLRKQRSGPAPTLPASVMARIGRRLGERPERPPLGWRTSWRAAAALAAALLALEAGALMERRLVEARRSRQLSSGGTLAALPAPSLPRFAVEEQSLKVAAPSTVGESPRERALPLKGEPRREGSNRRSLPSPALEGQPSGSTVAPTPRVRPLARTETDRAPPPVPATASPSEAPRPSDAAAPASGATTAPTITPWERPSPASPSETSDLEAAALRRGLELKRAGSYDAAVTALEDYREAYPRGVFRREAAVAELDAELSLGHRERALSLLDRLGDDPSLPRSAELRLLRAELAAREGRCREALPIFESSGGVSSLAERALYGRAGCLQALGRFAESRRGFEELLARFPRGSLAGEARRALGPLH